MTTPSPVTPASNKTLWAAVGVLSLVVLAMGATLIRSQSQPAPTQATELAPDNAQLLTAKPHASAATDAANMPSIETTNAAANKALNSAQALTNKAQQAITLEASNSRVTTPTVTPQRVRPQHDEPAVAQAPARTATAPSICANCGTVHSVTLVERDAEGTGVGAVGGGVAGNAVEEKMKEVIHYNVVVQMDDGSSRSFQHSTALPVGTRVTVDANTLRSAEK
jgi:uncharacterized protein YcfJ